ncbi:MAG TPA: hypothetical protein VGR53_07000 [Nitrososphaerales archaeon]|nr:hypothetical protein [Nitrososphaerales archaeon]
MNDDVLGLARKSRVADNVLLSWGLTEMFVDRMVLMAFGIDALDETSREFLTRRSFETKLNFLSKRGILTPDESKRVKAFVKERNSLFHSPEGGLLPLMKVKERKSLKLLGVNSARASAYAFARLLGTRADKETQEWVKHESFEGD